MRDERRNSGEYYPGGRVIARPGTAPQQVVVQWSDVQGKPQIAPLPERYKDSDVKTKINEIASKFATVLMAAFVVWTACADVTVQKKRKDEIYNDELVVVDVTGGGTDTNAVIGIANATIATNPVVAATRTLAGEALDLAANAETHAQMARSAAAAAQSTAAAAQSTADQAVTDAAYAQSTADQAATDAANAQSIADQAMTDAANAQSIADQAMTDAANAKSAADQASADAQSAMTTAQSAYGEVQGAIAIAGQAQSTADYALGEALSAQATADDAYRLADAAAPQATTYTKAETDARVSAVTQDVLRVINDVPQNLRYTITAGDKRFYFTPIGAINPED